MADALLSMNAEETKTSTSSFRSPGGPTPTRGLFFLERALRSHGSQFSAELRDLTAENFLP
jgi:hypothetical protein